MFSLRFPSFRVVLCLALNKDEYIKPRLKSNSTDSSKVYQVLTFTISPGIKCVIYMKYYFGSRNENETKRRKKENKRKSKEEKNVVNSSKKSGKKWRRKNSVQYLSNIKVKELHRMFFTFVSPLRSSLAQFLRLIVSCFDWNYVQRKSVFYFSSYYYIMVILLSRSRFIQNLKKKKTQEVCTTFFTLKLKEMT